MQVILPEGYLAAVYEEMRAEGAACIADEVWFARHMKSHMSSELIAIL